MESTKSYTRVKWACYTTNISMSVVANLAPILFLGFRELYGISYSLLGLLVVVNFSTQLLVDLWLSLYSHRINTKMAVKLTPVLAAFGLVMFSLAPVIFPGAVYIGLLIGTVIYSAAGGLGEVLISPVIAAIPAENPDRELSKLHSVYAWGVVFVVPASSLFLLLMGTDSWQILAMAFAAIPLIAVLLFVGAELPELQTEERTGGVLSHFKNPILWVCLIGIFLGGASECTMAQWASGYLEGALGIDKIWGDIFGVALFAAMLGLGRTLYSKYGRVAERVLLLGAIGALVCYLTASLCPIPVIGLIACALTGFFTSMLWPGSLIIGGERMPSGGVFMFAIMAAGGDLGASVGPQLVGIIADAVSANMSAVSATADAIGMRVGMLVGAIFPLAAIFVYLYLLKTRKKNN